MMPVSTRNRNKISGESVIHVGGKCGSQDLFFSQQSLGTSSQRSHDGDRSQKSEVINRDVREQLEREIWVQCDNVACQKWRRVTPQELAGVGDGKWFCFMNSDHHHSNCDAQEEDYLAYDKLARKIGLKYVFSCLTEGTLVWAKMVGYCRWPALITKDPNCGLSMERDKDGDPLFYHVEYLGYPHSHGWVRSHFVVAYGHKADGERLSGSDSNCPNSTDKHQVPSHKGKSLSRRGKALTQANQKQVRQRYKRHSVEGAVQEADTLLNLTDEERLGKIIFKWVLEQQARQGVGQSITENSGPVVVYEFEDTCSAEGNSELPEKKTTVKKKKPSKQNSTKTMKSKRFADQNIIGLHSACGTVILEEDLISLHQTTAQQWEESRQAVGNTSRKPNEVGLLKRTLLDMGKDKITLSGMCQDKITLSGMCQDKTTPHDIGPKKTNPADNPFCAFSSSLQNQSKEEKLAFDVQMYARNEKAFEHDVRRFLDRHGMQIRHIPTWQNITISLFQLFMAVHEQGGYHQVCNRRGWAKIYREVTNHPTSNTGTLAKTYYLRNLLPYELYLRGEDYDHLMKESDRGAKRSRPSTDHQGEDGRDSISQSECSDDLQALWADLDQSSHLFDLDLDEDADVPQEDPEPLVRRCGLDVLFYDESPDKVFSPGVQLADTASEFGHADLPEEDARLVPRSQPSSAQSGRFTEDEDMDEDMLADLENVQHQINALHNQLLMEE